jgi:antitoxin MazE
MRAKISKWGNSLGIRLPKALAEETGLRAGQMVDLSASGSGFDVRKGVETPRYSLAELVAEMDRLGPENRPPFVDWGILPSEWPDEDWSDIAPKDKELEAGLDRRPPARRR